MGIWDIFLGTLFVIVCILLIIVVLLQKGRGGGLGAAFGGAGQSAFGTRTGDVFTWVTIVLTGLFLLLAVGTTLSFRPLQTKVAPPSIMPAETGVSMQNLDADGKIVVAIEKHDKREEVRYTTNGDEPTQTKESSTKYDGTFVVDPGTTVKAKAFLSGRSSDTATAHYPTVDAMKKAASAPAAETQPAASTKPAPKTQPTTKGSAMPKAPASTLPAVH